MELSVSEISAAVGGRIIYGDENIKVKNISLNSRVMKGDDLFVPVIGERVDAHRFILQAISNGAVCSFTSRHKSLEDLKKDFGENESGFICDEAFSENSEKTEKKPHSLTHSFALISVDDTVAALQALGAYYRDNYVKIPFVGVTGSVGKTTTREMIASALSAGFRVYATKGNSNSQVGVPITVTETDSDAQIGVIELGMSEFGEMTRISNVAKPDTAVITNIGISHINQLKTRENILIQKLHITDGMRSGGVLILNGDDEYLKDIDEKKLHEYGIAEDKELKLLFYGTGENCDFRAQDIVLKDGYPEFTIVDTHTGERARKSLSVMGDHMILNAVASVCAASVYGIKIEDSFSALSGFTGVKGRGEIYKVSGMTIIDDSYNAAPDSMKAGLKVLWDMPCGNRKKAVLADMLELGEKEAEYHREVGEFMAQNGILPDELLLLGNLSENIAKGLTENLSSREKTPSIKHFSELSELMDYLKASLKPGDTVLFKGSNSMGLSKAVKALLED